MGQRHGLRSHNAGSWVSRSPPRCPGVLTPRPACPLHADPSWGQLVARLGRVKVGTLPALPRHGAARHGGPSSPTCCALFPKLVRLPAARNSQLGEELKKGRQPILDKGGANPGHSALPQGPGREESKAPSALAPCSKFAGARDNGAATFHELNHKLLPCRTGHGSCGHPPHVAEGATHSLFPAGRAGVPSPSPRAALRVHSPRVQPSP